MKNLRRLQKELKDLSCDPPEGVVCYMKMDNLMELEAKLHPFKETPYEKGTFTLSINIGDRLTLL